MDAIINGAGTVGKGEYETITVNGSANINGDVICSEFTVNGACNSSGKVECKNELTVRGSAQFGKDISADSLKCTGSARFNGGVYCKNIMVSGAVRFAGEIKSVNFKSTGAFESDGILNSENVEISFSGSSKIKEICGNKISIDCRSESKGILKKIFSSKKNGRLTVTDGIEGNDISVSGVIAPIVTGKNVIIGEDCIIDSVVYSESVEVSPKAKVKESKKV